jgi:hypothetical protein
MAIDAHAVTHRQLVPTAQWRANPLTWLDHLAEPAWYAIRQDLLDRPVENHAREPAVRNRLLVVVRYPEPGSLMHPGGAPIFGLGETIIIGFGVIALIRFGGNAHEQDQLPQGREH